MQISLQMPGFLAALAMWACSLTAHAQQPQLTGPNVITPPFVSVPFVSSSLLVKDGVIKNGKCVFSISLSIKPGEVPAGFQLAEIQRAYDVVACRELVERGLVRSDQTGGRYSEPGAIGSSGKLQSSAGAPSGSSSTSATASLGTQIDAYTQVLYTDGNNPFVQPLRAYTNGITTSYVDITFQVFPGDCVMTFPSADYQWSEYVNPYTQWTIPTAATAVGGIDCSSVSLDVTATHRNSFSIPFIFSCSDVVLINYAPLRLTVGYDGTKAANGFDNVTGDMTQCGEYLARFTTLQ